MSVINLEILVERLNDVCKQALESALATVVNYQQASVELAHWLYKILQHQDAQLHKLLESFNLSAVSMQQILLDSIERYPSHTNTAPTISQTVIDWACEAWLIANLEYNCDEINSSFLLCALLSDTLLKQQALRILPQLKLIDVHRLRVKLADINSQPKSTSHQIISTDTPLEQYTIDLVKQAQTGKIDNVIGRDAEIRQVMDVLLRRRQNNPILTGEPGVGKTAVVEGLALQIMRGAVPDKLKHARLLALDLGLLQAGAGVKGEFEKRLYALIQQIKQSSVPIILFIDEVHTLIGAGNQPGQGDAANLIKPALARGELRTIGATTWSEYKKYFEKDVALVRRFQMIKVAEPCQAVAIQMLQSLLPALEKHHDVVVQPQAIDAAVHLSHQYLSERKLPDKAISVLDTACARISVDQHSSDTQLTVTKDSIAKVLSNWTGIPSSTMLRDANAQLLMLKDNLAQRVKGQDHALTQICHTLQASGAKLLADNKPVGVFLLVGPSGVGKTETAYALAEQVYGGQSKLTVINMSEFKEAHKVSTLTGAPPGYVGYGEGGVLTEAVRRQPYSLVLLDEMEKAHPSVQEIFYQVFDKGVLRDGEGRDVDFKNTLIIMTANSASEFILQYQSKHNDKIQFQKALHHELEKTFKPAFLGRVCVIGYQPLSENILYAIIQSQFALLQKRVMTHYAINVEFNDSVYNAVLSQCHEQSLGARQINNIITQQLLPVLSTQLLKIVAQKLQIKELLVSYNQNYFRVC